MTVTTKTEVDQAALISALQHNYEAEMVGAATYRALADRESDARRADIIRRMGANEEQHAARWTERLQQLSGSIPAGPFTPRAEIMLSAQVSSIDHALRKLEATEDADVKKYQGQALRFNDPATVAIITDLVKDEQGHRQSLEAMAGPVRDPQSRLTAILTGEKHASTGSWIGDAIYGINDGLGSVFGIVSGVSGATVSSGTSHFVLIAGLAGMVEVIAIQGQLRGGISNGYGYVGFLVAWLAAQKPGLIVFMAALLGLITFGGDTLQIASNLPSATVNILMALILFFVLRDQGLRARKATA